MDTVALGLQELPHSERVGAPNCAERHLCVTHGTAQNGTQREDAGANVCPSDVSGGKLPWTHADVAARETPMGSVFAACHHDDREFPVQRRSRPSDTDYVGRVGRTGKGAVS